MMSLSYFVADLVFAAPTLILPGIGAVLSITTRRRLGGAVPLLVLAFLLLLADGLLGVGQLLMRAFVDPGPVNYVAILSVPSTMLLVAGWVLLLVAIFRRRDHGAAASAGAPPPAWTPSAGPAAAPPTASTGPVAHGSPAPATDAPPPVRPPVPPADPADRPPTPPGHPSPPS